MASATSPYLAPFSCSLVAASYIWSQVQPAAGSGMPAALKASTSYQMPYVFISEGTPPILPSAVVQFFMAVASKLPVPKSPEPESFEDQSVSRPWPVYCCSVSLPHQNRSGSFWAWVSAESLSL